MVISSALRARGCAPGQGRWKLIMGLWNFAKSVGAKIFGSSPAQAAPAEQLKKEAEK